jgi:hypothetical protein
MVMCVKKNARDPFSGVEKIAFVFFFSELQIRLLKTTTLGGVHI